MTIQVAGYAPRLECQLDGSTTAGEDCGVSTVSTAVDWSTRGDKHPSTEKVRKNMGVPSGPTNTADQKKACDAFQVPYERLVSAPVGRLKDAILENKFVSVSMDYGRVSNNHPELSGDKDFHGSHTIGVLGHRHREDGSLEVGVWDPLYDGRRSDIPDGAQWWPWELLANTCEDFTGTQGTFTGGIVRTESHWEGSTGGPGTDDDDEPPRGLEDISRAHAYRAWEAAQSAPWTSRDPDGHARDGIRPEPEDDEPDGTE